MRGGPERAYAHLLPRYSGVPWLALLRAFEVAAAAELIGAAEGPVLDLGCGDGLVAGLAFGRQLEAGVDLDGEALARARQAGAYRTVCRASAERLPFRSEAFGLVYSNGALEHMDDLDRVIAEVHRVLRPGGRFVFFVPNERFRRPVGVLLRIAGRRFWDAVNRLHHHVNLLSAQQWSELLARAGFALERIAPYGGRKAAAFVATRDALSKVMLRRRSPRLRHGGDLMAPAALGAAQRARRLARAGVFDDGGYWLAVAARRR